MANHFRREFVGSFAAIALLSATAVDAPQQGQIPRHTRFRGPMPWLSPRPLRPRRGRPKLRPHSGQRPGLYLDAASGYCNPVDWFPGDHPPMPAIVAHRRSPDDESVDRKLRLVPLPNGKGRPENASITGLSRGLYSGATCGLQTGSAKDVRSRQTNTGVNGRERRRHYGRGNKRRRQVFFLD